MAFHNVFRKVSRRRSNQDEHSSLSSASISMPGQMMPSGHKHSHLTKERNEGLPTKITEKKSANVNKVEAYVNFMSNFTTVEDLESFFVSEGMYLPDDMPPSPIHNFALLFEHIDNAFPDLFFTYRSIEEIGPNTVVVERVQFFGTHTGVPYTPIHGKLSEIPTSGKNVVVDEERWFFELEGEKLKSFTVVALGYFTGPMGIYEKLGQILAEDHLPRKE